MAKYVLQKEPTVGNIANDEKYPQKLSYKILQFNNFNRLYAMTSFLISFSKNYLIYMLTS